MPFLIFSPPGVSEENSGDSKDNRVHCSFSVLFSEASPWGTIGSFEETKLRVRSFGVIWISDPRSVWIMVYQRNRWIRDQSGFIGSFFDAPWSRQILDHLLITPKERTLSKLYYAVTKVLGALWLALYSRDIVWLGQVTGVILHDTFPMIGDW